MELGYKYMIEFCKHLRSFQQLEEGDQVMLLKGSINKFHDKFYRSIDWWKYRFLIWRTADSLPKIFTLYETQCVDLYADTYVFCPYSTDLCNHKVRFSHMELMDPGCSMLARRLGDNEKNHIIIFCSTALVMNFLNSNRFLATFDPDWQKDRTLALILMAAALFEPGNRIYANPETIQSAYHKYKQLLLRRVIFI